MIIKSVKFKGHHCFKQHWSGLDDIRPINVIIGRNNTGKSHFLGFVNGLCTTIFGLSPWDTQVQFAVDDEMLHKVFNQNTYHQVHRHLVNSDCRWVKESGKSVTVEGVHSAIQHVQQRDLDELAKYIRQEKHSLHGRTFKHLLADRDITPEKASNTLELAPNGPGATNIVRRFLLSEDNQKYPRELIQKTMLDDLNEIFGDDGQFSEITVFHKDGDTDTPKDEYEIYLGQEHKGAVSLSNSGSGLKTIFLVLLQLLVIPKIEGGKNFNRYVFAFEELENNLHPALLRRLLAYLESKVSTDVDTPFEGQPCFFLTTHSNVALDYFAGREQSQIIHITHDGKSAKAETINQSGQALRALRDLGTRPSDLLQANGIIWVEGPSDRIYINRWIEILTDNEYQEGRHYQIAFYGGGLLAHLQATPDEDADEKLINLMKINSNVVVVSDSDKEKKTSQLKSRVRRIRNEFETFLDKRTTYHWILGAREIENYLTGDLINEALKKSVAGLKAPEQYERMFSGAATADKGYLESKAKRKSFDKNELALLTTPHMTLEEMSARFDWQKSMEAVIQRIREWNK